MIIKLRVFLTGSVCFLFAWPVLGQSPPPALQVSVSPRDGSILVTETTNSVFAKVSNFDAFTNITVTGSFVAQQNIFFIDDENIDRKSTRLNSSHSQISYAVFCLKKKKKKEM